VTFRACERGGAEPAENRVSGTERWAGLIERSMTDQKFRSRPPAMALSERGSRHALSVERLFWAVRMLWWRCLHLITARHSNTLTSVSMWHHQYNVTKDNCSYRCRRQIDNFSPTNTKSTSDVTIIISPKLIVTKFSGAMSKHSLNTSSLHVVGPAHDSTLLFINRNNIMYGTNKNQYVGN